MALTKIRLGEILKLCEIKNEDLKYGIKDVKGISIQKIFIETKANMEGVSLKPYYLVQPDDFAYVTVTSRNGEKITLAHNVTSDTYLVSSSYIVFRVKRKDLLLSDYLFMYFNRPEFDRYSRFNSWGSARETFSWDDFCDIELDLPPIEIQQKYVDVYNAMLANQQSYERGLEDLRIACISTIEKLKRNTKSVSILSYLTERHEINKENTYTDLKGVGNEGFIIPRGSRDSSTFCKCNIFYPKDFVYNPSVVSKGAIAFNADFITPKICTEEYIVFYITDENLLSPEYLFLWLKRKETGRFLEFLNMDSVRNRVYFKDLECINIPLPNIEIQLDIANIYKVYNERKQINEKLKAQIKDICPVLIKGSIEEAKKEA